MAGIIFAVSSTYPHTRESTTKTKTNPVNGRLVYAWLYDALIKRKASKRSNATVCFIRMYMLLGLRCISFSNGVRKNRPTTNNDRIAEKGKRSFSSHC